MPATDRLDAMQRPQIIGTARNHRCRQLAVTHQPRLTVAVGEKGLDQGRALNDTGRDRFPVVRRDHERHVAEGPWPFRVGRLVVEAGNRTIARDNAGNADALLVALSAAQCRRHAAL